MPSHQPVRFVSREDWVQPIEHQLNNYRLTKPFDAEGQPCLEGVRFIGTKRQQQLLQQRNGHLCVEGHGSGVTALSVPRWGGVAASVNRSDVR